MRCCVLFALLLCTGCASQEGTWFPTLQAPSEDWQVKRIVSKNKGGSEFRSKGQVSSDERWSYETGVVAEFYNGTKLGLTGRGRYVNSGDGADDYGLFLEWQVPIWEDTSRNK